MIVDIEIRLDPDSPGFVQLGKIEKRLEDTAGLLDELGNALLETTKQRFADETDPSGAKWTPLKPITVAERGSAHPILMRSGRLKGSINYKVDGNTLQLGPTAVHGAVHQFGHTFQLQVGKAGKRGSRKSGGTGRTVPARAYVGIGAADREAIDETAQDWFDVK